MISVSGVLRTMLTYAVPIQLSIGTGESRIAASSVPRMSAPTAEYTVNWMVVQNASKIWVWYLLNSSTSVGDRLLVEGRRRRRGDTRGPEILVERRLPGSVLHHLSDRVVDLGPEIGVALLQSYAVALLRERLAYDLEGAWALRGVAGQDHLIGRDGVDRTVLQRLNAR